jgi:hypothetical protein
MLLMISEREEKRSGRRRHLFLMFEKNVVKN